jgi:hypothetical protein
MDEILAKLRDVQACRYELGPGLCASCRQRLREVIETLMLVDGQVELELCS